MVVMLKSPRNDCGNQIENFNQFNYLGYILNYNGEFHITQQPFAFQGRKIMYSLKKQN